MEREVIKVYFPYLKAFAEDKEVQCNISGEWKDIEEISFSIGVEHYRIKPVYRPFKNQEECWQEMLKHHPFGWIQTKKIRKPRQINKFTDLCIVIMEDYITFKDAMVVYEYEFIDGTPFGIRED